MLSTSSAPTSALPSARTRSRYQTTIVTSENTKMMVDTALISGVMPRRRRPQISSGRVLSRPIRKKLTAISSIESVKISKRRADDRQLQVRNGHAPERLPVVCAQIERRFFLRAIEFLQSCEDFGGRHRDQGRAVPQDNRQQAELRAHHVEQHEQRESGDDPGQNQRQQHQPAKQRLPGKLRAIQRQRGRDAERQRDRHGSQCYLQAVQDRIPDRPIGKQDAVPVEREVVRRKSADSLAVE